MARRVLLLIIFFALAAMTVSMASALPVSPVSISTYSSSSRTLPDQSNGSVEAQGGNVTQINIDALSITKAWQGYYGNVTGNIHLDDANNNSFYIWGNATTLSGEIYASRNSTVLWGSVGCANDTLRTQEDAYLGLAFTDGDSVMNTFNGTSHPQFYVGASPIVNDTCFSTNAFVNGTAQNASFHQILLADNASNVIYSTIIEGRSHVYNGQVADFQLLVGENEHLGSVGPTQYYFFVEIS